MFGDNIHEPTNTVEWLLSPGPLHLNDDLSLLPEASPMATAVPSCVNLNAMVLLFEAHVPVAISNILLAVAAGVI